MLSCFPPRARRACATGLRGPPAPGYYRGALRAPERPLFACVYPGRAYPSHLASSLSNRAFQSDWSISDVAFQ
jgi:hypothetical protein